MSVIQALILGLVEGLTEFLPVSSTGHLILAGRLLGLPSTEFQKSFEIVIQLGAILSVVAYYARSLVADWETMKRLAIAFLPTGALGLAFYRVIKTSFLGNERLVLWSLLIGGVAIVLFELFHHEHERDTANVHCVTYGQAFGIGLFQSLAVIPGVSRAAATILGGMLLGVRRRTVVEFSFLLAVPTMAAATGYDLLKNAASFSSSDLTLMSVGFAGSFVVALASIAFLLRFVKRHTLLGFGVYRVVAALVGFWIV